MQELLKAISGTINGCNYNYPILFNQTTDLPRPSFLVYFVSSAVKDMNYAVMNENAHIRVVYYAPLTSGTFKDRMNQLDVMDALKKAFCKQLIYNTLDRTARIQKVKVRYTKDKDIFLKLNMDIHSLRNTDKEELPLMENISINNEEVIK